MRWPRQLVYLLVLVLLLVVPPVMLVTVVGWPHQGWPGLRQWVAQPLTEQTLTVALTVAAWLVWLMLAVTVALRVAAWIWSGGRWLRRVPLPTPLQATATGVAGAAAFGVGAQTGTSTPLEHPLPLTAGTLDHPADGRAVNGEDVSHGDPNGGVVVPGGWLPREVAEQVAAAAGLVWLRRRRTYQPRPTGTHPRDDGDLTPLPATVNAVQAALATPPAQAPATPTTGGDTCQLPGTIAPLPAGAVTLTGPGALAAARGLLVTAVLTAVRHPSPAPLIVTRTALTMLLDPTTAPMWTQLPGVRIADTTDGAAVLLATPAAEQDSSGWRPQRATAAAPSRPVLIVESSPPAGPLAAAVTAGTATAVILGASTVGTTWHVDAAGHTHDPRRPDQAGIRLCVLDPVAATDLLTVITQAHPPDPYPAASSGPATIAAPEPPRIPRQMTGKSPSRPPSHAARTTNAMLAATTIGGLELHVLGEPVLLAGGTPVPVRRSAALQVLVFLAVHADGATTGQLAQAIWPGLPAHRLSGRLYTTLSDLRSTIRAASGLTVLDHADNRYRLHPGYWQVDLWRLQALAAHAATAVTNPVTAWQAVIDAYTGDLAAGHPWPWLDPAREAARRHVLDAYVALAAAEPDPLRALDLLQAGIRVDPYNQALHQRAISILTALGEHDTAAELADTYTRRLTAAADAHHTAPRHDAEPLPGR